MKCLEDSNVVTQLCQIACAGQTSRAGTDNGNLLAVFLLRCLRNKTVFSGPVSHETLQLTDGDRLTLNSANAFAFALALLRAHTATYCRKCGRLSDDIGCSLKVSGLDFFDEARDINGDRAAAHTLCIIFTF